MTRVHNPLPQLIPHRLQGTLRQVGELIWVRGKSLTVRAGPVNTVAVELAKAGKQRLTEIKPGTFYGPPKGDWVQRWFTVEIPPAVATERGRRYLNWNCQGESTIYIDGQPWAGIDAGHPHAPLPDRACTLWIDNGCYSTGIWAPGFQAIGEHGLRFDSACIALRDEAHWAAWHDLDAVQQVVAQLLKQVDLLGPDYVGFQPTMEKAPPLVRRLLHAADQACDAWVAEGVAGLRTNLAALYKNFPAESYQPEAALVGHAHLDLVWLWPEWATERKGVHTAATQLRLMERYPEFRFSQSQPALYRAMERQAPEQMRAIRKRIDEGRWEIMGGFEVEPDTHLPCGEALARSLVMGQAKTTELTGKPSPVCWIPDVFGYSAILPQLLRLAGVTGFYTTKMTWSTVTRFPYSSFIWRGADGSEITTHLCADGYNGEAKVENTLNALAHHRQVAEHPAMLLCQGYGDGGGGVSDTIIERSRRLRSLAGVPTHRWTSAVEFMATLEKRRATLPVYQGELYLEYHRGTYTTQSDFKLAYRRAERALQVHEAVRVVTGGKPVEQSGWQRVAFAQFHDAIPGSSIGIVYKQLGGELSAQAAACTASAAKELAAGGRTRGQLVFNPLPLPRIAVVTLPVGTLAVATPDGLTVPVQSTPAGTLAVVRLPALGAERLNPGEGSRSEDCGLVQTATTSVLDNGLLCAEFDREGQLAALTIDGVAQRVVAGSGLRLYHDRAANFDAWDIDHYVLKHGVAVADHLRLTVIESGPVRAVLRGEGTIGAGSPVTVDYILEAGSRWLRIEVRVAWRERHRLLKWHLATGHRGRHARFGTAFGSILRPQQPGDQSAEAMWEVPGSRWAAATDEDGQGLAMVSEAKFGFSCKDGDLGLSLLRAPTDPDPEADQGDHHLRFAVGRYDSTTRGDVAATAAMADLLFTDPMVVNGGTLTPPLFTWEDLGSLVPAWVLPEADGGYTIRLHEVAGGSGTAVLALTAAPDAVELIDFLGKSLGKPRRRSPRTYALAYQPYQILSVRVR